VSRSGAAWTVTGLSVHNVSSSTSWRQGARACFIFVQTGLSLAEVKKGTNDMTFSSLWYCWS
jgi:hypothetical protein